MTTCNICCSDYNKSSRAQIQCKNKECDVDACKECIRTYLSTQTADPHCMGCKIAYDDNFIVMNLNRTWVEKDFRKHRKSVLLDQQMSRMPETVEAAERFNEIASIGKINMDLGVQIMDLRNEIRGLEIERNRNNTRIYNLNRHGNSNGEVQEKRKFIMACPDEECRGYLSTAYKCEMCKLFTCSRCLEIIGHDKTNSGHVCDEDKVKTADFIKSTTKPCPGCGERIHKVEGCDQMWCIQCHVAFSWKSGIIDNGVVHNPHFYAHQRAGGGAAMRNPGEIACGGMPQWWGLRNEIRRKLNVWMKAAAVAGDGAGETNMKIRIFCDRLGELHRTFADIQHNELQRARHKVRDYSNYEEDRIRYILKQYSKDEMANSVIRKDKLRRKYTEFVHLYELIHVVSVDLFRWIDNYVRNEAVIVEDKSDIHDPLMIDTVFEKIDELESLREYINEQFGLISISYNQKVPQFQPKSWRMTSKKFSLKAAKTKARQTKNTNEKIGSNSFT